ncbi:LysM peptidoglycan-binding domain-containing protein [Stutzerimonas stutzeri]|uniref:LysM peptidoglycan-binding domain-containing protein n=1 Tax=Stutzerimonas stutzeri TaxID=316 RepID=UPI000F7B731A|nr:LysM peptidoglycan-binding domain-containing protein [Stutzerimonas stutzeri]MCP3430533.1 LysM peptidoglycan-binding domain-containing protein [Stutzerimonas stutzeri]RRV56507.1 LysM peptidoglycan-binding domain-containing protein [Stutzerimonas stutzeri]RTM23595.1 LysM peptidoglycan-binding domain-containing protein [Stutzerimonas stutzeri]
MEYTIQRGDTLTRIASDHGTTVSSLLRLNPQIEDPNQIQAGQVLRMPATSSPARPGCTTGQIMQDSQCSGAAFDAAFYWNEKVQSRQAIYEAIYGREMHFLHRSLFQRNNEHLNETVLPGEIVIISNMPRTDADRQRLEILREQARLASEGIQQLTPAEAMTVKRHLQVLDYVSLETVASHQSTALGVLSVAAGRQLGDVKSTLQKINVAYVDELSRTGNPNRFSPEFYAKRQQLFGQLDHSLGRLTLSTISIRNYDSIKTTLGLSTKSILHNASAITERGEVPQLGQRINTVSNWAKGAGRLGYLGIAIDGGVRMNKIQEACTVGSNQACARTSYMQVTGFVGSAGGGAVGGIAGAKVATAFVGGIALAFGVTFGAPALAIIAVAGAAAGAYYGGSGGGGFGEYVGDIIYQRVKR